MNLRTLSLGTLLIAALVLVTGTGAFSGASLDRGVDAAVVDDENAYLGIKVVETEGTVGSEFTLLRITDQAASDIDLDSVSVTSANPPISVVDGGPAALDPSADIVVQCDEVATPEDVELRIEASGGGMAVVKHKTVTVSCEATPTPTPTPTP